MIKKQIYKGYKLWSILLVMTSLITFGQNMPYEFVDINAHLNKSSYISGESILGKAYIRNWSLNRETIEVSLYNNQARQTIFNTILSFSNNQTVFQVYLPKDIKTGVYSLIFYIHGTSRIISSISFPVLNIDDPFIKSTDKVVSFKMFPEGGSLLDGIENKVAFHLSDSNDPDPDFTGFVIDPQADTISIFRPTQFGIGAFFITPLAGRNYQVNIKLKNGQIQNFSLPSVTAQGSYLMLKDTNDFILVKAGLNTTNPVGEHVMVVSSKSKILMFEKLEKSEAVYSLNKSTLPPGIIQVGLLSNRVMVNERLLYNKIELKYTIETKSIPINPSTRTGVELEIVVKDQGEIQLLLNSLFQ